MRKGLCMWHCGGARGTEAEWAQEGRTVQAWRCLPREGVVGARMDRMSACWWTEKTEAPEERLRVSGNMSLA